jgi:hypothetical protein
MTQLNMTTSVISVFREMGYAQTSDDVAKIILGIETTPDTNGKSVYVEGSEGSEFEDTFYNTMPQWLGSKHTEMLRKKLGAHIRGEESLLEEDRVDADCSLSRARFQHLSRSRMNKS